MIEKILETARSKHAQWGIIGVAVGISVGLVIGIALSSHSTSNTTDSYENAKIAAGKLGWDTLDKLTTSSQLLNRYDELGNLELQLSELVAQSMQKAGNKLTKTENLPEEKMTPVLGSIVSSPINPSTKTDSNPTTNDETTESNTGKYKDGVGTKDIYTASLEEIDAIPYVKPQAAKEIYNYLQNNKINSFDELLKLNGVGEKTIERLRELYHIK